jgi:hypothetical protein
MWNRLWVTNQVYDLYRNSMDIVSVTKKNAVSFPEERYIEACNPDESSCLLRYDNT